MYKLYIFIQIETVTKIDIESKLKLEGNTNSSLKAALLTSLLFLCGLVSTGSLLHVVYQSSQQSKMAAV